MKPIVTVAIPFYNAEKYLAASISSVLLQTYENWKLLLIDDGSTDSSLFIAESFAVKDDRIEIYSDGKNKNLAFRLNQIPTLVESKYLARMDADDVMHPKRIEKQIEVLLKNPLIDVLGTNAYSIDEESKVIGIRIDTRTNDGLISTCSFIHPTIMAKTSWFVKNPYDVKALRVEDSELWARTVNQYKFMVLSEPLLFYREYNGDYYKKYWRSLSGEFHVWRKNKYNFTGLKNMISTVLKTGVYFVFEKVFKSNFLINRRNQILFPHCKEIGEFV